MSGILGARPADFHLEIFDCDCVEPEEKMYDSIDSDRSVKAVQSLYNINKYVDISGHQWTVRIHSLASFESQLNIHRSLMVLYIGLVASVLLSVLVWLLVNGRTRAINLAQQMTIELRNSKERLELATKAGIIGIWDWDVVHNRLVWDDAMYRIYGISREDFYGAYEAWTSSLHPEDKDYVEAEIQAALNGAREYAPEFKILWPDGSVHYIKSASHTIFDSKGIALRMVGINYDLTAVKLAEQNLVLANELSEQANRSKGDFLANMSHEIRSPLNAIMGMTELVLNSQLTEDQRIDIEIIQESSRSLLQLINDILDFAKIEAKKLNLESVAFDFRAQVAQGGSQCRFG
ncbi:MAG: PAS domain-containing protein, partial [Magnetococcus sp. XQGC-1]